MEISKINLNEIMNCWIQVQLLSNDKVCGKVLGILEQELVLEQSDGAKKWLKVADMIAFTVIQEEQAGASIPESGFLLLQKLLHPEQVAESLSSLFRQWVKESTIEEMVRFAGQEQVRQLYRRENLNTYITPEEYTYYKQLADKGGRVLPTADEALENALIKYILRNPQGFKGWNLYSKIWKDSRAEDEALGYCLTLIPCILNSNTQYDSQNIANINDMLKASGELDARYGVYTIFNWLYMFKLRKNISNDLPLVSALRAFTKGKTYEEKECDIYYFRQFTGKEQEQFRHKVVRDYIRLLAEVNDNIQFDYNYLYNKCAHFLATEWGEELFYYDCFRETILQEDALLGVQMCREILYDMVRFPMDEERKERHFTFVLQVFEDINHWSVDEESRPLMEVCRQLIPLIRENAGNPVLAAILPLLSPYPNPVKKDELDKYMKPLESRQALEVLQYLTKCYGYGNGVVSMRMEEAYRKCLAVCMEAGMEDGLGMQQLLEGMCELQMGRLGSQNTGSVVMNQNCQKAILCMLLSGREQSLGDVEQAYRTAYGKTERFERFLVYQEAVTKLWRADKNFASQLFLAILSDHWKGFLERTLEAGSILQQAVVDFLVTERIGARKSLFRLYLQQLHQEEVGQIIINLGGPEQKVLEQLEGITLSQEERKLLINLLWLRFPTLEKMEGLLAQPERVSLFWALMDAVFGTKVVMDMLRKASVHATGYELWKQAAMDLYGSEEFLEQVQAPEEETESYVYRSKELEADFFYEFSFLDNYEEASVDANTDKRKELEEQLRNYTRWGFARSQMECLEALLPIYRKSAKDIVFYNDACVRLSLLWCDQELRLNPEQARTIFWELLISMEQKGYRYSRRNKEILKELLPRILVGYSIQELKAQRSSLQILEGLRAFRNNGLTQEVVTTFIDQIRGVLELWSSDAPGYYEMQQKCNASMELLQRSVSADRYGMSVKHQWYAQLKKEKERLEQGAILLATVKERAEEEKAEVTIQLQNVGKQAASGLKIRMLPGEGWKCETLEKRRGDLAAEEQDDARFAMIPVTEEETMPLAYTLEWIYMDGELRQESGTRESLLAEAERQRMDAQLAQTTRKQVAAALENQREELAEVKETLKKVEATTQGIDETTKRTDATTQGIEETTRRTDETTQAIKKDTEEILSVLSTDLAQIKALLPASGGRPQAEVASQARENYVQGITAVVEHNANRQGVSVSACEGDMNATWIPAEWNVPVDDAMKGVLNIAFWLKINYADAEQQVNGQVDCSPVMAMLGKFLESYLNQVLLGKLKLVDGNYQVKIDGVWKTLGDSRVQKMMLGNYTWLLGASVKQGNNWQANPFRRPLMARIETGNILRQEQEMNALWSRMNKCRLNRNDADHADSKVSYQELENSIRYLFTGNKPLVKQIRDLADAIDSNQTV
ncbi:MAG: hypothetical protein IJ335_04705 [Lachnospiraceae bacterium]|nr:hypothetical protein [Lachnospiraceae bacterium]